MAGFLNNNSSHGLERWSSFFESRTERRSPHALKHWSQVQRLGWPISKNENWRYTPLDRLLDKEFTEPLDQIVTSEQCSTLALKLDAYRLVFVNGRFSATLSDSYLGDYRLEILTNIGTETLPDPIQSEIFLHLTESLAQEISIIHLRVSKATVRPLYLFHISKGSETNIETNTMHYRHHLVIASGAKAEVIEHYVSLNDSVHFTGARLTASVADNSELLHCKLAVENELSYHFSHNDLAIENYARVKTDNFLLGSGLTRHNTSAQLNGIGASLTINSLLLPIDREIFDSRTYLEHNRGYCESRQLHKAAVSGGARAIFNGRINVAKHSVKTDGHMINHNLILGESAEVNTKPQLEIYADDVKCSHGATVGHIDVDQLFYMQSRGINKNTAKQMIILAFSSELTDSIANKPLREEILKYIARRLSQGKIYELSD